MPNAVARQDCRKEVLRSVPVGADAARVNVTFAALNIIVVVVLLVVFVVPRLKEHQESKVEVPRAIRPNRAGQELADVVTEWAKTTGVLKADGAVDPNHEPIADPNFTDEAS